MGMQKEGKRCSGPGYKAVFCVVKLLSCLAGWWVVCFASVPSA